MRQVPPPLRCALAGPGERAGAGGVFSKSPTSRREIGVMPHALCVHVSVLFMHLRASHGPAVID